MPTVATPAPNGAVVKQCTHCGEWKPLSAFSPCATRLDGIRPDCRACRNADVRAFRRNRRNEIVQGKRARLQAHPKQQQCVRCGIQSRHLDRAGYCPCCQFETAYGEVYTYWNTHGIRVRVEGMAEPQEPPQREHGIPAPDWPTRGALAEVRL